MGGGPATAVPSRGGHAQGGGSERTFSAPLEQLGDAEVPGATEDGNLEPELRSTSGCLGLSSSEGADLLPSPGEGGPSPGGQRATCLLH